MPGHACPNTNLALSRHWLARLVRLDHFGAWFEIALTVMLLNGTLVPFMVTAPKVQVELPSEIVLDPAGAD